MFGCSGTFSMYKNDETSGTKNLTRSLCILIIAFLEYWLFKHWSQLQSLYSSTGIEVGIMKKLCKQEVIGMRIKVSGLNSVHLICDSYFNFWFKHWNRNRN